MENTDWFLAVKKGYLGLGFKALDILLISQIEEFQNNRLECYMSNEQFSNLFGESLSKVKRSLDRLESLDVIERKNHYVQGNGKSTKQRVLRLNDKSKWKVHNEPTKMEYQDGEEKWKVHNEPTKMEYQDGEEKWKVHNEPTKMGDSEKWKVHNEPTKYEKDENGRFIMNLPNQNGRFIMNLPNAMEGSKNDFGRFKNAKWKVHNEPIKDNLKENLKSRDAHPSGSLDGNFVPSEGAVLPERPTDAAAQNAQPRKNQAKPSNLDSLSLEELDYIEECFYEKKRYNDICDELGLKRGTITKNVISDIEAIRKSRELDTHRDDASISLHSLDSSCCLDSGLLDRASRYSGVCSEDLKDMVPKHGMSLDRFVGYLEDSDGMIYERSYYDSDDVDKDMYPDYWDWVGMLYHANSEKVLDGSRKGLLDTVDVCIDNAVDGKFNDAIDGKFNGDSLDDIDVVDGKFEDIPDGKSDDAHTENSTSDDGAENTSDTENSNILPFDASLVDLSWLDDIAC